MIESSTPPAPPAELSIKALAQATRFALAMIVIAFAYFPFRFSLGISRYERVIEDMLGAGSQLPAITKFVFATAPGMMVVSGVLFFAPIAVLFMRNIPRALYVLGTLAVVAIVHGIVVFQAVILPFTEIITRMQGGTPGM